VITAAAGCWLKAVVTSELVGVAAGDDQAADQSEDLTAHRLLDCLGLAKLGPTQHVAHPGGFGFQAAAPVGAVQHRGQAARGQPGCLSRGGRGDQERAGLRGAAARRACEGVQEYLQLGQGGGLGLLGAEPFFRVCWNRSMLSPGSGDGWACRSSRYKR
jgi:hypothetical protein